ncbi:DUF4118 domain-containing protein [Streptomyces sp. NPDC056669]|uniref:sensor histidine kinase n=1 Tax=Streptomyces sp. NPDC056669 TaxID=3345903 RepID=UPI0036B06F37
MARGRLRIHLGAAPGVGKTYAMLQEGQRLRGQGADVVIGLVEPHGRRLTAALAEGLETVPRHTLVHRGTAFTEMDLDAVLARRPQVALVDELAHTNVPGSRNTKRWQDVDELLDAGIDVVTTLNIQHLESLNDVVRQITGVTQHETLPDEVARRADQIELVDLLPETLRRRLVHGDVYPQDRVEGALTHYFRLGNLTALRELALLWLADRVEEGLQRYRAEHGITAPWETRERIMVGLTGGPEGETLIRRAARITTRTPGSELLALHVVPGNGLAQPNRLGVLARQRALVESLGGSYHQTVGEDVPEALLRFAEDENVTQIVLGASRRGRFSLLLRAGVGQRTIHRSGPIDVHIVTHEQAAKGPSLGLPRPARGTGPARLWSALAGAAVLLPLLTLVLIALRDRMGLPGALVLYMLAVVLTALVGGVLPALVTAVAAGLLADYYFVRPLHSLDVVGTIDVVALAVFLAAAWLVGTASGAAARRTGQARRATSEARVLSRLAAAMMRGQDLPALLEQVRENFSLTSVSLLERGPGPGPVRQPGPVREPEHAREPRWYVVASTGERPPERPRQGDVEVPIGDRLTLAAYGHGLSGDDQRILSACATQIGIAHTHGALTRHAAETDTLAAAERTRASLLLTASHDLRAPLHSAEDALVRLRDLQPTGPSREASRLLAAARSAVRRAAQLVTDLDDLSRLHAGALDLYLRPVDLDEALTAALDDLGTSGRTIALHLPEQLPYVIADAALLTRVLTALGADALRHSTPDTPPALTAEARPERLTVRITDGTTSEPNGSRADSLPLRLSRDLTEAMGGTLDHTTGPRAFAVTLTFPTSTHHAGR